MARKTPKTAVVAFKVEEELAEFLNKLPNKSAFIRKAIAAQMTNAEWLHSSPGTPQQKRPLLSCVGCHTLERVFRSTHDPEAFVKTIQRMGTYANQSTVLRPQKRLTGRDTDLVGEDRAKLFRTNAEYFASINQSQRAGSGWTYELKTFPRPLRCLHRPTSHGAKRPSTSGRVTRYATRARFAPDSRR